MATLYQTLEDRFNIDEVEANGPYPGTERKRWLGTGYYFWDTFIKLAHFWGEVSYKRQGKDYIIAQSKVTFPQGKLLNLQDSEDIERFQSWKKELETTFPGHEITVEQVISHIERIMGDNFPYCAIKALFVNSINTNKFQDRLFAKKNTYVDLCPPVQVCIKDKSVIGKNNFKVIYPESYAERTSFIL